MIKRKNGSIENGRKRKYYFRMAGILATIMLTVCMGCQDKPRYNDMHHDKEAKPDTESILEENETAEQKSEQKTQTNPSEWFVQQKPLIENQTTEETEEQEPSGSFKVAYQGQEAKNEIELRHCERIYDADGIKIYAKYIYDLMVPVTFPSDQYVLYIQTPQEQTQFYPIADFLVDEEQKTLYTEIEGDNGFECVQCFSLAEKDSFISDTRTELFDLGQAEKMLCDAFEKAESSYSDIIVELTEIKTGSAGILCGETGGIEKATGQWYYVDWEIDLSDNTQSLTPCILKQYDPIKDKEIFDESSRIFDQIEQGDWSGVNPVTNTDYQREGLEYLWGASDGEWLRMDVNGDGLPELINGWWESMVSYFDEDVKKIEVTYIFTYKENAAELVYVDINDGMEFLYVTGNGNLVYEWCVSGGPCTNIQRLCQFDVKWKKDYLDTLVRYRFPEDEGGMAEYYTENYPDTYGIGGEGVYYLRERPKTEQELADNEDGEYTVREYLTEMQFLNVYKEMTGWDFYASQYMY